MVGIIRGGPRKRVLQVFSSAVALLVGCISGPSVEDFGPARTGAGVSVEFRLAGEPTRRIYGELLSVEQSSFLVVVHNVQPPLAASPPEPYVARLWMTAIEQARFGEIMSRRSFKLPVPDRVRLSSRYPYGVTPELLARLLEAYEQPGLVVHPPDSGGDEEPLGATSGPLPATGSVHSDRTSIDGFRTTARDATRRYHAASVALADGFRPVGEDSPAMGRHWVNPARLFSRDVSAERPAILMYIDVEGQAVLTGIAYAVPLEDLATVSSAIPAPLEAWHVHTGALAAESHKPDHISNPPMSDDTGVAVLHAWVWTENPAGLFAPDNWKLPWLRLGLLPPLDAPVAAAKAIALCTEEGYEHFAFQWRASMRSSSSVEQETAAVELEEARRTALARCRLLEGARPSTDEVAEFRRLGEHLGALGF